MPQEGGRVHRKVLPVSLLSNLTIPSPLPHNKLEHIMSALSLGLEDGDTAGPTCSACPCQLSSLGSCPWCLQELSGPAGRSA